VTRLQGYLRGALQRRIFFWFGVSILIASVASTLVTWIVGGLGEPAWRHQLEVGKSLVRDQFARVWDSPVDRVELARQISQTTERDVTLIDEDGRVLSSVGTPCGYVAQSISIERAGRSLGAVRICARHRLWIARRLGLPLLLTAAVLWAASGVIARRLGRPLWEISRVAQELGAGKLSTRASIAPREAEELQVVAQSINEMADRIEKQMADQRVLLAAVSHELRTPLARVRLLVELMRQGEPEAKTLGELDHEVLEIDRLVGELLASSRLDFAALRPAELEAVEVGTRALERAGVSASLLKVEALDTRFVGDPTLIARALANLVDNAQTHGGGLASLRIFERDGFIAFEADDAGVGFAPGDEERVFQPFYRGPKDGRGSVDGRSAPGLGLGLALVRRIAQAHGGSAYAFNRQPRGAAVVLEVKRLASLEDEPEPARSTGPSGAPLPS